MHADVAIAGAGIVGLAHAWHLARRGKKVVVFERHSRASGASVRNFGMLWPIGQPAGEKYQLARRSLEIWRDVLQTIGQWHVACGSLHLAYHDDEQRVLEEFLQQHRDAAMDCKLWSADQIRDHSPWVNAQGLRCGLFSPHETAIDPRHSVHGIAAWLSQQSQLRIEFDCPVLGYDRPAVVTSRGKFSADQLLVCCGDELRTLYPHCFDDSGLVPCKLQMMRSRPLQGGWQFGPMLAAGLTLQHYQSFAACPSLPRLRERFQRELPDYLRWGIHVMATQNAAGELVLGDSHEYGDAIDAFDKQEIDDLVLRYLQSFLAVPQLHIATRWHGIYVKHPTLSYFKASPADGVTVITGLGGAGMTMSFGLAEQLINDGNIA